MQIDRQTLYTTILECECIYQHSKRRLVDVYFEVYESCHDFQERVHLIKVINGLLALRCDYNRFVL
jgi:hypothetical protein